MPDNSKPRVKQIRIEVITRNLENLDSPPDIKQMDHANQSDREWLAKHCWWAMLHNHSVLTYPIEGPKFI